MKYKTAQGFRQALEERLRRQSLQGGQPLARLRKMVAFDRFLARLTKREPEAWIVKGGFALQLRIGERARTTKDIDVSAAKPWTREQTLSHVRAAASLDLRDWFEFEVGEPAEAATGTPGRGYRFPIRCLLDGRQFENFHLDVAYGDPVVGAPDMLVAPQFLAFAGIPPATVPCYPLTTQVAEKLHAYTRTYVRGETTRARDLADILFAASLQEFDSVELKQALVATFQARASHDLPRQMPDPPAAITASYRRLASQLDLPWPTITEAGRAVAEFLNPVLKSNARSKWSPVTWTWI